MFADFGSAIFQGEFVFDFGEDLDGDGHQDERNEFDHKADAGKNGAEIGPIFQQQVQAE